MAFALRFDGVNDYTTLDTPNPMHQNQTAWSLIVRLRIFNFGSNGHTWLYGGTSSTAGSIRITDNAARIRYGTTNVVIVNTGIDLADGLFHTVEFRRTSGGTHSMLVDGSPVGTAPGDSSTNTTNVTVLGTANAGSSGNFSEFDLEFMQLYDSDTGGNLIYDWDAAGSSHEAGTPVLDELVSGNDVTGVNMPTDGSAWIDLGGSGITVTGATANYNYAGISGAVDLTGEIIVTGATANYDYEGIIGSIDLTGEIIVTGATANYDYDGLPGVIEIGAEIVVVGQTANYDYSAIDGTVELTGLITVIGQTANYDYDGIAADIILQGSIVVTGSTANYDYNALNGTIILQGPITVNPRNIIRVKRQSNTIRVKRSSNIVRVR